MATLKLQGRRDRFTEKLQLLRCSKKHLNLTLIRTLVRTYRLLNYRMVLGKLRNILRFTPYCKLSLVIMILLVDRQLIVRCILVSPFFAMTLPRLLVERKALMDGRLTMNARVRTYVSIRPTLSWKLTLIGRKVVTLQVLVVLFLCLNGRRKNVLSFR